MLSRARCEGLLVERGSRNAELSLELERMDLVVYASARLLMMLIELGMC